jgi:hypothetical protein
MAIMANDQEVKYLVPGLERGLQLLWPLASSIAI